MENYIFMILIGLMWLLICGAYDSHFRAKISEEIYLARLRGVEELKTPNDIQVILKSCILGTLTTLVLVIVTFGPFYLLQKYKNMKIEEVIKKKPPVVCRFQEYRILIENPTLKVVSNTLFIMLPNGFFVKFEDYCEEV